MHSRLIFLHHVLFLMGGRLLEFPVSYGYDTGGSELIGRKIRQSQDSGSSQSGLGRREEKRVGQEKPLGLSNMCPYRKPTQVDGCKSTKAYERNIVRELGKTAAVTSG